MIPHAWPHSSKSVQNKQFSSSVSRRKKETWHPSLTCLNITSAETKREEENVIFINFVVSDATALECVSANEEQTKLNWKCSWSQILTFFWDWIFFFFSHSCFYTQLTGCEPIPQTAKKVGSGEWIRSFRETDRWISQLINRQTDRQLGLPTCRFLDGWDLSKAGNGVFAIN